MVDKVIPEVERLAAELDTLMHEENFIRKTLEYVRLAQEKNSIEGLEIQSKIRELKSKSLREEARAAEAQVSQNISNSVDSLNFDDPSVINQTKLNLDVQQGQFNFCEEEEENEDSD